MRTPRRQGGAALLLIIVLFLAILPAALLAIFHRTLQNDTYSNGYLWRAQARDAANQAMSALRLSVAGAIGSGGLLEYQPSPPAWYIQNGTNPNLKPTTAGFWTSCKTQSTPLCQSSTLTLNNGTGRQQFNILELVTPTGVIDTSLCAQQGYVAVFYNLWVQATASSNPAAGTATTQAVYRACVRPN